jgi:hypothetical protein
MKKLFVTLAFLFSVAILMAQTTITMKPDTAGTIAGTASGVTHTFTVGPISGGSYTYSVEVYVTASGTHATDSTHVTLYASMDGTNYFKLTDQGIPWLLSYAAYNSTDLPTYTAKRLSSAGATAGWVWHPTWYLQYRYYQVRVTQYKVGSVLTINKARLHLFKNATY